MLVHPQFDPVALSIGPVQVAGHVLGPIAIHWYGLTYMAAFAIFLVLAVRRAGLPWFARAGWSRRDVEDMLFYGVLGVVLGGRLGYVLFYKPGYYAAHPFEVLEVWHGGMSFHGGMLGVIVAMVLFAHSRRRPWLQVTDLIAPCVPLGLGCGRIGNFINGELWGRAADPSLPWAMVFPQSGTSIPRHPSELYEFGLEGLLLFAIMWLYARRERGQGQVSGLFLLAYGAMRFIAEYFREPDEFLKDLPATTGLSMGQWLCVPMILAGLALWAWGRGRPTAGPAVGAPAGAGSGR
jgi:phosphatidylglycerol:prolipoprotein diacylglycerol transferase